MKKLCSRFIATGLFLALLLIPAVPASAASPDDASKISVFASCTHTYTSIKTGPIINETCTTVSRNYREVCRDCGIEVKSGIITEYKDTPTHSFSWRSVGCNKKTHTYEKVCSKCGQKGETLTKACNGNCIYPNRIIESVS